MARIPAAPSEIEKELLKVWRAAAVEDRTLTGEAAPRMRVVLSNIIILLLQQNTASTQFVEDLITSVAVAHPSRVFVLTLTEGGFGPEGRSPLKAAVSSRCVTARSGAHVCTEEIYLDLPAAAAGSARNLLLSLLAPDVATVVFLYGDPIGGLSAAESSPAAFQICALADRIIYEGLFFSNYPTGIESLIRMEALGALDEGGRSSYGAPYEQSDFKLRDLNWQRLRRWRTLVAEQFDTKQFAGKIESIRSLTVCSNTSTSDLLDGNLPSGALLLSAWIANRLGWSGRHWTARPEGKALVIDSDAGICLRFRGAEREAIESRSLAALSFELEDSGGTARLNIRHGVGDQPAEISMTAPTGEELYLRKAALAAESVVDLALKELVSTELPIEFRKALTGSLDLARAARQRS